MYRFLQCGIVLKSFRSTYLKQLTRIESSFAIQASTRVLSCLVTITWQLQLQHCSAVTWRRYGCGGEQQQTLQAPFDQQDNCGLSFKSVSSYLILLSGATEQRRSATTVEGDTSPLPDKNAIMNFGIWLRTVVTLHSKTFLEKMVSRFHCRQRDVKRLLFFFTEGRFFKIRETLAGTLFFDGPLEHWDVWKHIYS